MKKRMKSKIVISGILSAAMVFGGLIQVPLTQGGAADSARAAAKNAGAMAAGEDQVIVFMKDGAGIQAEELEDKVGCVDDVKSVADEKGMGEIAVATSNDSSAGKMVKALEKRSDVLFAEPNYQGQLASKDFTGQQYSAEMKNGLGIAGWNKKDASGKPAPKVSSKGKVVAVMDSGIDYEHEDLSGVMWEDGLKYKKLKAMGGGKYGINLAYKGADEKYDTKDPMDDFYHGTHIAGIIAGEWNNYGVSGMTSGAKLMAIKVAHEKGSFSVLNVIKGYQYLIAAKKAGVNICAVNCSLSFPVYSRAIDLLAREAGKLGIVTCFASGNESMDTDYSAQDNNQYGDNPYIVTVGASNAKGQPTGFSNYGRRTVDVYSPGAGIMSTVPTSMGDLNKNGVPAKDAEGKDLATGFEDVTVTGNKESSVFGFAAKDCDMSLSNVAHTGSKGLMLKGKVKDDQCEMTITTDPLKSARGISLWAKIPGIFNGSKSILVMNGDKMAEDVEIKEDDDNANWFNIRGVFKSKHEPLKLQLLFNSEDEKDKPITTMYIDDVKLTNDVSPYKKESGTSMATPAVAGGAAILSSYFKKDGAAKIAARIQGSVKRVKKMKNKSISGGIFRVDKALAGKTNPVLRSASVSGKKVTVKGYFFGKKKGKLTIAGKKCKVTRWKDGKVVAKLPKKFKAGENKIYVTTKAKRSGHQFFRLKTPKSLFKRLPLPGRKVKGNPGIYKIKSKKYDKTFYSYAPKALVGQRGKLYYLMSDTKIQKDGHAKCVIFEYNIKKKKWKKKFTGGYTPEGAACTWNGKILFKAIDELNDKTYLSLYDPKKNKIKSKLVNKNASECKTELVNNGSKVMEFGGYLEQYVTMGDKKTFFGPARVVNPKKLTRKKLGGPVLQADSVKAIYDKKKNTYVITAERTEGSKFKGMYKLNVKKNKLKAKKIVDKDLFKKMLKNTGGQTDTYVVGGPVKGGAIYSGPLTVKNKNKEVTADTYRFTFKKKNKGLVPMKKRVSMSRLSAPCATTYRGHYYVIAQTNSENGKWVFATTKVKTIKQPGDKK